mgnify:CR=1 FL=1
MEKLKKILDSETNKWIVKKAKPQVFGIIIMSVIFGGMAYLGVAVATLSRGIVDSAVNSDVGGIVYFAIILISLTIAQLVIRIISKVLTFNVSSKLEISIKQDIFDNIIRKKYNEISSIHTGELLNRITSDVSVLVSSIISIVPNMVYFIVKLVGAAFEAVQKDVREKHPSTLTADAALLLAKLSDAELAPLEAVAEDVGVDPAPYYTTRTLGEAFLAKCDFERLRSFEPLFEGEAGPAQAARAALLPNTFLQALVCRALTGRVPPEEMET